MTGSGGREPHTGAITGCVYDGQFNDPISGANAIILGQHDQPCGAATGETGRFLILDVPPGTYGMRAMALAFHPQEVFDIYVASDSISIVSFRMTNAALEILPVPMQWSTTDSTILPMTEFIASGRLFDLQCR